LPGDQDQLIEAVAKANPRTVVVLHTASAVLMPWRNRVGAIVEAWYPGQQSGTAIAKTLFGDVDPSGRLPVTFPASNFQGPLAGHPQRYPGIDNVAQYSEGLQVGYRWFDANRRHPLFPFGYGLSYTSFSLSQLKLSRRGGGYATAVKLRNAGRYAGAEVVQAYLQFPRCAGEPPLQLKAFAKTFLRPGRSAVVRLSLPRARFEYFNASRNAWTTASGRYRLYVGTSSRDLPLSRSISRP
jgi:beta-glucosidase